MEHLGRLVPLSCDRGIQEMEFEQSFHECSRQPERRPQMYIIAGPDTEAHGSLLQRLLFRLDLLTGRRGVLDKSVPWPDGGDFSQRRDRLIYGLLQAFSARSPLFAPPITELSGAAFVRVMEGALHGAIVVQHQIPESAWDHLTLQQLVAYQEFWRSLPLTGGEPPIVVFVNVCYTSAGGTMLLPASLLGRARRRRIANALAKLDSPPDSRCSCRRLTELGPVTLKDVRDSGTFTAP
jgi:hypothetical protein